MKTFTNMQMFEASADRRNSMTFWYPKIEKLEGVRTPETIIIKMDPQNYFDEMKRSNEIKQNLDDFYRAARKLGYPVFMRTSHASGKHSWKKTCYVETKSDLRKNLFGLLEHDYMADLISDAIVFRKYIPMESYFTAWHGDFPVNKEIRCFINNGKPECMHPYWFEDAVKQGSYWIKDRQWRQKLKKLMTFTEQDHREVMDMLLRVMPQFGNEWWSVDFAKAKSGEWYLIDCALGLASYHFKGCQFEPHFEGGI